MLNALIVLSLFGNVIASSLTDAGPCPAIETMANFDVTKYIGKWWITSNSIPDSHMQGKCSRETFTLHENGTISILSVEIQRSSGTEITTPSTVYIDNPAEPAKMIAENKQMLWILDTDYDSYAVTYHCRGSPRLHSTFVWFMTREQNPSESVLAKLDEIIEKYQFEKSSFHRIKQDDCVLRPS